MKKLRQLRKEIAQIKTVARERALGIRGAKKTESGDGQSPSRPRRVQRREPVNDGATEKHRRRRPRRNEKVGNVVSTKMQKTIVVEVEMRKAHPKYKRIVKSSKKFYAHDEQNSARRGRCGAHPRDAAVEQAEAVVA